MSMRLSIKKPHVWRSEENSRVAKLRVVSVPHRKYNANYRVSFDNVARLASFLPRLGDAICTAETTSVAK